MSHPALPGRTAAPRPPARWHQAVRAELVVLREARVLHWGWLVLLLAVSGMSVSGGDGDAPFRDVRYLASFMFFFPLAWQREEGSPRRNAPLPMADLTLELIRLACGAVCAALLLGLCVSGYAAMLWLSPVAVPGTLGGFPEWYPAALFLVGMANYLFGAAVMLRTERPGRVLLAAFVFGMLMAGILGIGTETVEHTVTSNSDGSETWTGTTSLTLGSAALHLALGVAAVGLSVAIGHARLIPRWTLRSRRRPAPAPLAGAARAPRPSAVRGKASLARIAVWQFNLLAPRMVGPLLVAAFMGGRMWMGQAEARGGALPFIVGHDAFGWLWPVASLWPLLVWMDERRAHPWDEAHPAGILERRLVHAAAGFAWLLVLVMGLLAAAIGGALWAGTLASPAQVPARLWIGLPAAMLMFYSLGTLTTVWTDRPGLVGILYLFVLLPLLVGIDFLLTGFRLDGIPQPFSPTRLLVPLNWHGPAGDWSALSTLLWTPVFAALAVAAIRRRVRRDRHHTAPPPQPSIPRTAPA